MPLKMRLIQVVETGSKHVYRRLGIRSMSRWDAGPYARSSS